MNQGGPPPQPRTRWRLVPDSWLDAQRRERDLLRSELGQMRGLMPILMKRRNGADWTRQERALLVAQIHSMAHISPYLVVLVLPGSFLVLPALAWWLDRRRQHRNRQVSGGNG